MIKETALWPLPQLAARFTTIDFPEYQREPNVWSRDAKQRLIDSIMRQFDVASIYLYRNTDESFDCIDGRQRIGAIMSFWGQNPEDGDNNFEYQVLNEIYDDESHPFEELEGKTFAQIRQLASAGNRTAAQFVEVIDTYRITVVMLARSKDAQEFHLQFTRLNLGTIINSGEKLNAMIGDLRDACFGNGGLGQHPFLESAGIPTRRYSREQLAAQIVGQVFSLADEEEFGRTRHFDLQKLFKDHARMDERHRRLVEEVRRQLDNLHASVDRPEVLRNRAMTVSTVALAWRESFDRPTAKAFGEFLEEFLCRLKWQVGKGLDVDDQYRYLIAFQRHVTQASVERPAVAERHRVLLEEFAHYRDTGRLQGDEEYEALFGRDPSDACRD